MIWLALLGSFGWGGVPEGLVWVDVGDRAWAKGDRNEAREAWNQASESADPAAVAMAEVRLLRVGGNLGLVVHGPRADAALVRCGDERGWCALARADRWLTLRDLGLEPAGGTEGARWAAIARLELPEAAQERLVWAGVAPVGSLMDGESGLGACLRTGGGAWPSGPGTWSMGLGVVGGVGSGLGGGVRFLHPDLGLRGAWLETSALVTSRGNLSLSMGASVGEPWGLLARMSVQRYYFDYYVDDSLVYSRVVDSLELGVAPSAHFGSTKAWVGPLLRWDKSPELWFNPGVFGGAKWRRSAWVAEFGGVVGLRQVFGVGELSVGRSPTKGLAGRLLSQAALGEVPSWRLPQVGGGQVLRSGPAGRWRGPRLGAFALEERLVFGDRLGGVGFFEGAAVAGRRGDGLHGGLGLGIRVRVPPQPSPPIRLDVAWGDGGWGFSAGWGESF